MVDVRALLAILALTPAVIACTEPEPDDSTKNLSTGCHALYSMFSDKCPPTEGESWSCPEVTSSFSMCELVCEQGSCSADEGSLAEVVGAYKMQGDDGEPTFELSMQDDEVVYKSLINKNVDDEEAEPISTVVRGNASNGGSTVYLASGFLFDLSECVGRYVRFTTIELTSGDCSARAGKMRTLEISGCGTSFSAYDSEIECAP